MAQDIEAFGIGLHQAVLDAVMDHLDEMARPIVAAVQVAQLGRAAELLAAWRSGDVARAWCEHAEDRIETRDDIVLAAEDTTFVTAFAGIGVSGDGGGTWHLPRLIGARRAAQAYLQNKPIDAVHALEWGLLNEIVPADELRGRATAVATELAQGPTRAFGRMRKLLRDAWNNDLSMHLQAETEALRATGASADAANAIASFAAKRKPNFTGR